MQDQNLIYKYRDFSENMDKIILNVELYFAIRGAL